MVSKSVFVFQSLEDTIHLAAQQLETLSKDKITNRLRKGFKLGLTLLSPSTRFPFRCCCHSLFFCYFDCEAKLNFPLYFASNNFISKA